MLLEREDPFVQHHGRQSVFCYRIVGLPPPARRRYSSIDKGRDAARLSVLSQPERQLLEILSVIPGSVPLSARNYLYPDNGETLAMACVGRNLLIKMAYPFDRLVHQRRSLKRR